MSRFVVDVVDLRQAITAVLPHVAADKKLDTLRRLRLTPFGQNLEVTATDRYTVGLAIVSMWDADEDGTPIDLSPTDVRKILTVFTPPDKGEQATVEFRAESGDLTIADKGGLIDGESLTLPLFTPEEQFPNVRELFAGRLQGSREVFTDAWFNAELLVRFRAASKAYGYPLIWTRLPDPSTAFIVRCGESFLGMVTQIRPDEDARKEAARWAEAWDRRLPPPGFKITPADWLRYGSAWSYSGGEVDEDQAPAAESEPSQAESIDDHLDGGGEA